MSTPTQQVCARCGSPAAAGDAFCGNCGISRLVTQPPPSSEYVRREPGTDSAEHTESAYDPRLSSVAEQFDPQAQAPSTPPSDPPPLSPQPDWTDTVRSFARRMPVWAKLAALGVVGLLILLAVQGIKDSSAGSSSGSGDAAACSTYWAILSDVNNQDYSDAAAQIPVLAGDISGITNSALSQAVTGYTTDSDDNDATDASAESYVIGGTCTGLGYANPN